MKKFKMIILLFVFLIVYEPIIVQSSIPNTETENHETTGVSYINDSYYQMEIEPRYTAVTNFLNGRAFVRVGDFLGLWGVIDLHGNYIIEPMYLSLNRMFTSHYEGGFFLLQENDFSDFLIVRSIENGYYGIVDFDNNTIIPFVYDEIIALEGTDFIRVSKTIDGKQTEGLYNLITGEIVIPIGLYSGNRINIEYNIVHVWIGDFFSDAYHGVINLDTLEEIIPVIYGGIGNIRNGIIPLRLHETNHYFHGNSSPHNLPIWGFADTNGNIITDFKYLLQTTRTLGENYIFIVNEDGLLGTIDRYGNYGVYPQFSHDAWNIAGSLYRLSDFFPARNEDNLWGIIYKDGIEKIPFIYSYIEILNEDFAIVAIDLRDAKEEVITHRNIVYSILNLNTGEYILPFVNDILIRDNFNNIVFVVQDDNRINMGVLNLETEEIIIEPMYNDIFQLSNNLFAASKGSELLQIRGGDGLWDNLYLFFGQKWGIVNSYGDTILQFEYDLIRVPIMRNNTTNNKQDFNYDFEPNTFLVAIGDIPTEFWEPYIAKWGMVNSSGNFILEPKYDFIDEIFFSNGLTRTNIGGKWIQGYVNGHEMIGGYWGILDIYGNVIIPAQMPFTRIGMPNENMIPVEMDGLWGFIRIID
ncbi:MAG: WG repeat-containing protein [Defluviitaleaceae bacterium]|nr:WG repeat-containing protein [Defluviitaleaceae bacterium]